MSVTNKHGLGAVVANTVTFGGVSRYSVSTGTQVDSEATTGEVYPRALFMTAQKPGAEFSTYHIAKALTLTGVLGKSLAAITGGLLFYAAKHADGGTRASGSVHTKYSFLDGLLLPRTLTVDHQGHASLSLAVVSTYDGTNAPVIVAHDQALPTAAADDERFTLGPFKLGNVVMGQLQNLSIDFGISEAPEGADSDLWDTLVSIEEIKPMLTLRGSNLQWLGSSAVPLDGLACAHADTILYLRKRAAGATHFVANATAEHIKLTAAGLAHITEAVSAQQRGAAQCTIQIPLNFDGTNAPLTVTPSSAIVAFT